MKKWKATAALLLALGMLGACVGCGNDESSTSDSAAETSMTESTDDTDSNTAVASGTTSLENKTPYQLSFDEEIPSELANTIATYFYAIDSQDYDLYLAQINPIYREAMDALLQEQYGYGIEVDFEQYHQALVNYAGTEDYTITSISMSLAEEALADEYDEGTDFVGDYLDAYAQALGDDFVTELETHSNAIYDIALTMLGEDGDGNTITLMSQLEILVVESEDGTFGILG